MKFRKFLCYVLIFAIMMSLGVTAFADGIALHGNSSIAAITNDEFEALFGTGNADAEYNYNVSRTMKDDIFHVSMSATISVGENDYLLTAAGDVDLLELTDGSSILNGPLYGEISIGEINLPLTAGFTKSVGESEINAGIVINPLIDSDAQIMFAFGERVMADDVDVVRPNVSLESAPISPSDEEVSPLEVDANFVKKGSITKKLANVSSVNGQTLSVYYASNANRVGIRVQPYVNAVKSYYDNLNKVSSKVRVSKLVISLSRNSATDISSIKGLDYMTSQYSSSSFINIKNLILAFLDLFGLPTSGLDSALSSLTSQLTYSSTGRQATLTCKYGAASSTASLDKPGMMAAFNLDPSTASHSAIYNVSSQVQYSVTYNIPLSGATSFYVAASNASLSYSLWLTK